MTCPLSCPKETYQSLRFFQLAATVPIGWHNFGYRRRLDPWVPVPNSPRLMWVRHGQAARSERNAGCRFSSVTTMSTRPSGC